LRSVVFFARRFAIAIVFVSDPERESGGWGTRAHPIQRLSVLRLAGSLDEALLDQLSGVLVGAAGSARTFSFGLYRERRIYFRFTEDSEELKRLSLGRGLYHDPVPVEGSEEPVPVLLITNYCHFRLRLSDVAVK
jgi:hypothetical protein